MRSAARRKRPGSRRGSSGSSGAPLPHTGFLDARAACRLAKADQLGDKSTPRFVVTSFSPLEHPAQQLYEDIYCARGDMGKPGAHPVRAKPAKRRGETPSVPRRDRRR